MSYTHWMDVTEEDKEVARIYIEAHDRRVSTCYMDRSFEYFSGPMIREMFIENTGNKYEKNMLYHTIMELLPDKIGNNRDENSIELYYLCNKVLGVTNYWEGLM